MRAVNKLNRFVNVYDLTFREDSPNLIRVAGVFEAKDYDEAKKAFPIIRNDERFKHNRFSVQIQDFDATGVYPLVDYIA